MEKKKKNGIIIGIVAILLIMLTLLGLTYAYYRTRIIDNKKEKSVTVATKESLEVVYTDGTSSFTLNQEIEPGIEGSKTFSVKNNDSKPAKFNIVLENIVNTFTRLEDWTYILTKGNEEISRGTISNNNYQVLVGNEEIDGGANENYSLKIVYANANEDQSVDMDKDMKFKVNIVDTNYVWEKAEKGTLLYALKASHDIVDPVTTPGQVTATEEIMSTTEDDYGTSYYYRGHVDNNHINYGGMCWRIVRVQGDGGIKITLADEKNECNSETYSNSKVTAFLNSGNSYTHDQLEENTILETWLASKNVDTTKIETVKWCSDTRVNTETGVHQANERLTNTETAKPTLRCKDETGEILGVEKNIGMLTADEVAFAGMAAVEGGRSYLKTNTGYSYWTLTPYDSTVVFMVHSKNSLKASVSGGRYSVRPVLVLSSDVELVSGTGTQTSPYVIG